ncbi:tetratricopeptide repeat protein [Lacunisphaera limnophila]|uniref:Tetratricopeptide repeat protein n=1 Tax=Lacunisphaera limnophila TaxID=1838286 RepID=A0A1I7PHH1_9BACT|nr:tetratricopeptide repeat protein [Lacunisphaera limnophila]AOS43052.1 tetratricopeptide repeat protein [Lacunisphaera limnophila]
MAKKVNRPGPAGGAKPAATLRWLPGALLAALLLGGGMAYWGSRSAGAAAWVDRPALPDLAGRPDELGRLLREAQARVEADGGTAASVAALGRIYHANSFLAEAGRCWTFLRTLEPAEARWAYYLADLARMRADEVALLAGLEETVRLAPDYAPAWLELAELEFKAGRLDRAEQAYRTRARLVPGDPYAGLGLARVALQQDRRAEGKRLIEETIRLAPDFPSSRNFYAEILAQEGDAAGAADQRWLGTVAGRFRAAADPWKDELRPGCCDVDQLVVWGAIDLQTKFGDRGRAYFERAVQIDPQNPQGFENLGMFLLEAGEPARAAAVLEQGSALPRATELLFSYLGDAYLALRQPEKALATAERGLGRMPDSGRFHNLRGLALAASERSDEALAAYREAMARAPGSAEPVANQGLLLLRLGRRDEGVASLKQALELQPGLAKAATMLAYLALEAGNLPAAATYVLPYYRQFPGLANARSLMARYHLLTALEAARRGDPAGVEQACRAGLAAVPESPELNGFLGVHLLQLGRLDEALPALEKSYQLQATDPRVALALGEAYARINRTSDARRILEAVAAEARRRNDAAVGGRVQAMLDRLP